MQREGFLEAFVQTGHRRGIEQPQLIAQGQKGGPCLLVLGLFIGGLQLPPPGGPAGPWADR